MLLALDVGNTNITLGVYDAEGTLWALSRLAADSSRMEDQYAIEILDILRIYQIAPEKVDGAVIGSVVPKLTFCLMRAVKKLFGVDAVNVQYEIVRSYFHVDVAHPEATGADLIAACVAAKEKYPMPCIVIDMGTATKLMVIDSDGRMLGGCIMPGLGISTDALFSKAALLSAVDMKTPRSVIGASTVECIQSGVVFGTASMIDGVCGRMEDELGEPCKLVGTGGHAQEILKNCVREVEYNETLVLDGLYIIYKKSAQSEMRDRKHVSI